MIPFNGGRWEGVWKTLHQQCPQGGRDTIASKFTHDQGCGHEWKIIYKANYLISYQPESPHEIIVLFVTVRNCWPTMDVGGFFQWSQEIFNWSWSHTGGGCSENEWRATGSGTCHWSMGVQQFFSPESTIQERPTSPSVTASCTALDLFERFFAIQDAWDLLVAETNRYAATVIGTSTPMADYSLPTLQRHYNYNLSACTY